MKTKSTKPFNQKSTRILSPSDDLPVQLFLGFFLLFMTGLAFYATLQAAINEIKITHDIPDEPQLVIMTGVSFIFLLAFIIGRITGIIRSKIHLHQEKLAIQNTNPYQYYKELPNNYGIGIASLLTDSTIENEKDIIAVILDLCAQGYLHLSKHSDRYVIQPQPNHPNSPLRNEQYILDLIHQGNLPNINFHTWYTYCIDDGVELGLYQRPDREPLVNSRNLSITISRDRRKRYKITTAITITILILSLITSVISDYSNNQTIENIAGVIFLISLVFLVMTLFFRIVSAASQFGKSVSHGTFQDELNAHLTKTPKGVEELQKLLAFRNFLAQFNTFVDQDPEAVILWDRYLSYAQVFGLSKELMHSGYSQLIDNAAFKIDNIDSITLDNLSLSA